MNKKTFKTVLSTVAAAVALSACTMIPKYEQPQVEVAETFKYDTFDDGIRAADLGWQDFFADPRLHRLIDIALERNTDLRTAALNAEIYRKQYMIARNDLLPSINASGTGTRVGSLSGGVTRSEYPVGLGAAAYELDLFGRVRSNSQAALQGYFSVAANRDAAHLALIAAVAKGRNLQDVLAAIRAAHPELTAQELGALQDIAYGCQRYLGSLKYMLAQMLKKPIDNPQLESLLLAAMYQLHYTRNAPHAVVNEAVESIAKIGRGQYRSFANAILRRFLRERQKLEASCKKDDVAKHNLPLWWVAYLKNHYPKHWHNITTALQSHPPMTLRINRHHGNAESYLEKLAAEGIAIFPVSAATREGLAALIAETAKALDRYVEEPEKTDGIKVYDADKDEDPERITITRNDRGDFIVSGKALEKLVAMTNFGNDEALRRFQYIWRMKGIDSRLKKRGIKEGDTVHIGAMEFEFRE